MHKDAVRIYLDTLMNNWKNQFDEEPSMENLSFSMNEHGMIEIAGQKLCPADMLLIEDYDVNPEHVELFLTDGDYITIEILWPNNSVPVVSAICLHHFMYRLTE